MRLFFLFLALTLLVYLRFVFLVSEKVPEGESSFIATLVDSPEQTNVQRFSLVHPTHQKLYLTTSRFPEYHYGEQLEVKGKIESIKTKDGRELLVMSFPQITKTERQNVLFQAAGFMRERVKTAYQRALPPESASLLLGVVLGVKEDMSQEFSDNLSKTGLMHVVAASGMNVTLLSGFVFDIFGRFFRKRVALVGSISVILFYAVLAGLEASILRASFMASLTFAVALFGRKSQVLVTFFITALGMLLIWPQLLYDIGFQLSCAATLGIIVIKPKLPFKIKKKQNLDTIGVLKEDITISLSTQITTLPILIFYFHSVGFLSLVSNTLVLWTVAPLMIIGGIAAIISLIILPIASFIALLTLPLTTFFIFIVNILGKLTPVLTLSQITWQMAVGYYLIVFSIFHLTSYAKKVRD